MSKPIVFQIEFSGWQHVRFDDGAAIRPPTAEEMAKMIAEDFQARCELMDRRDKLKVAFKRIQ